MSFKCDCEKFEEGMKAVNGPITLQSMRSGGAYQFDRNYVFRFCPWCGDPLYDPVIDKIGLKSLDGKIELEDVI